MYGMKRSKHDQQARADKFVRRGTLKSADFLARYRADNSKGLNPELLNLEDQKAFLNEQKDIVFMSKYYPNAVSKLIDELH